MSTKQKIIHLHPLLEVSTEIQLKVREIRNEENIKKWMYGDHTIELNEHLEWINQLKTNENQIIFVILDEQGTPLGVASVNSMDRAHKKTDWAYYLTNSARGGLGSAIEYSFIDFIFDKLEMQKLNCEVIEGNNPVLKLHEKFLFQAEGFRRSNIIKSGDRAGVHLLGLTRSDWVDGRLNVYHKYHKVLEKFDISINWQASKRLLHPIDEIESARARNNLNWMNILRLVLELSPDHGKALVTDIRNIDKKISRLTDKLIDS